MNFQANHFDDIFSEALTKEKELDLLFLLRNWSFGTCKKMPLKNLTTNVLGLSFTQELYPRDQLMSLCDSILHLT